MKCDISGTEPSSDHEREIARVVDRIALAGLTLARQDHFRDITNMTLLEIIRFAYGEGIAGNIEITGGPAWIGKNRYDIEGKSEGLATLSERKQMMKALLADRFGLKVHTQTKEVNVYSMTVARADGKLEPKVQTWDGTCGGRDAPPRNANPTGPRCAAFFRPPGMVLEGAPMRVVADMLSTPIANLGRPVVDKTGLTGE